jgi:peptidoglycan/LPS O-acetylase OafA/YrhL
LTVEGNRQNAVSGSPQSFWETPYFAPLDGLRALSLLLVVAGHCHTSVPVRRYFSGGLGVGIFFVLSGFLITILLLREQSSFGGISYGGFYIRRAFRILPPYVLTIGVYLLLGLMPSQHELKTRFLNGLPYFLTLRNEYVPAGLAVSFTHSWSLSVEEKFYLAWPLLFFWALPRIRSRWAVVPVTAAPLFVSTTQSLPVAYFSLLLGCCVAILLHRLRNQQARVLRCVQRVPLWLLLLAWVTSYYASLQATWRVSFILVTAALLPVLLLRQTALSRVLGSRVCTWVGKRTYSMYLLHAICLTLVERFVPPVTAWRFAAVVALTYGLSLGVATVVYRLVEKPAIAWGRKLAAAYAVARRAPIKTSQTPEYTVAVPR